MLRALVHLEDASTYQGNSEILQEHVELLDSIKGSDLEKAQAVFVQHLERGPDRLAAAYNAHNSDTA